MEDKKTEIETEIKVVNNKTISASPLSIPLAIVAAGIIIAGAIIYTSKTGGAVVSGQPQTGEQDQSKLLDKVNKITSEDHIRGDINAQVKIVEYSDTECPFCKQFHNSMKKLMTEYDGKVAWVYRHFPLEQLHPKARNEAAALECAGELGGNDAFWKYTDRIYEITPSNNGLDASELPKIAAFAGLDVTQFNSCLTSGKFEGEIEEDLQNALATGGNGTPWSIVISKKGKKYPINGALPYEMLKQVVEDALAEK